MGNSKRKEMIILLFCILIGFALRFYTFDQKSLWVDEVHTYNDSRDGFKNQITFYKENPTFLHPPLFFMLTHLFYPFEKPERDLRIIPLIFGTLSIPMIYLLARQFSSAIALPCTISLTLMTYHISLSQDGRSYSLLLFFGMAGLYFLMKHLQTSQKRYLPLVALAFAVLFHTSYSSIPFIVLSQMLWFYRPHRENPRLSLSSFFMLNGLILLLCLPWILFVAINYKGQTVMDPLHTETPGSLFYILSSVFHDWVPHAPLLIVSILLLILFPLFSKEKRAAFVLLAVFFLPIAGLYSFCKLFHLHHFVTSRYFINFLPLFLITLYLSLESMEMRWDSIRRLMRLKLLFLILFITSSLVILPLYYRSEKQDLRGLVAYLQNNLREGDTIFVETLGFIPGILHYVNYSPEKRHHTIPYLKLSEEIVHRKYFSYKKQRFAIYHSQTCCVQYTTDGGRLWIVVGKWFGKKLKKESPCVLKGYFDGSFLNFTRFPIDASFYLFLWDPKSPDEKGIDLPIE